MPIIKLATEESQDPSSEAALGLLLWVGQLLGNEISPPPQPPTQQEGGV